MVINQMQSQQPKNHQVGLKKQGENNGTQIKPERLLWLCVQGMAMGTRTLSSNGYYLINDNNIMQCAFFDILNYEIHTYIYN